MHSSIATRRGSSCSPINSLDRSGRTSYSSRSARRSEGARMFERYYGFSAPPFQLCPDARFFFPSSVHQKAKSYLTYGLHQGEGFIIITGEVGAGKTTLVGHLLSTLDRDRFVAANVVSTQLTADDMLRLIALSFG